MLLIEFSCASLRFFAIIAIALPTGSFRVGTLKVGYFCTSLQVVFYLLIYCSQQQKIIKKLLSMTQTTLMSPDPLPKTFKFIK